MDPMGDGISKLIIIWKNSCGDAIWIKVSYSISQL